MKLTMEFSGHCALVWPSTEHGPVHVLFVGGDDGAHGGGHGSVMSRHDPWLSAELAHTQASLEPRSIAVVDGRRFGLWDLRGYDLSIEPEPAGPMASPTLPSLPPGSPRAADMKAITGDGRIDESYVTAATPPPPGLSGRFVLRAGGLEYFPSRDGEPLWQFLPPVEPGTRPHEQCLADRIAYTLEAPSPGVSLVFRGLDGSGEKGCLKLSETDPVVSISNLPVESTARSTTEDPLEHFAAFYGLLMKPVPGNRLPMPSRWGAIAEGSFCPLASFQGP